MKHVMVDLETLGTKQDSAFISIGACQFDPGTGKIGDTFYENIDWDSALETRGVTGDTIKWWLQQSKEAKNAVLEPGRELPTVLLEFANWFCSGTQRIIWGNGATFDVSILENAYDRFGEAPWAFWNVRDVRTIVDLAWGICDKGDYPFVGTEHNALDDAKHQAKYVSAMWQALRKGVKI